MSKCNHSAFTRATHSASTQMRGLIHIDRLAHSYMYNLVMSPALEAGAGGSSSLPPQHSALQCSVGENSECKNQPHQSQQVKEKVLLQTHRVI